jgi:hypothetical protein
MDTCERWSDGQDAEVREVTGWGLELPVSYWKHRTPNTAALKCTWVHSLYWMHPGCNNTPSTPPHKSTPSALLYARLPAPRREYPLIANLSLCFYSLITIACCVVTPVATFVACWLQLWVSANCKLMIACCSTGCKHTWCVCPQGTANIWYKGRNLPLLPWLCKVGWF